MPKTSTVCLSLALILCTVLAAAASAQTETTGAIQGGVYYYEASALQPVLNAVVVIKNQDTGLERSARTNSEGNYRIDMLPPGLYLISATGEGYEQTAQSSYNNFQVYLSKTNLVRPPPIVLRKIGAAAPPTPAPTGTGAPAPTVQAEQLVNTLNATRGGNFDARQLVTLPLPDIRSFETLAFLLPGVAPPPQPVGGTVGPGIGAGIGTAGQFSVNGQRARSNNFTVDGSDNNDEDVGVRRQGFVSLVPQSVESVQEFQVFTHMWEANVGRNPGAQVNAVSKSGTNQIHGAVYGFFNHDTLNARNFFDYESDKAQSYPLRARVPGRFTGKSQDDLIQVGLLAPDLVTVRPVEQPNPSRDQNDYRRLQGGLTLGGPISKRYFGPLGAAEPKAFFFTSFERQGVQAEQETHFSVPTIAQRGFLGSGASGFTITGLNLVGGGGVPINPIFRPTFTAGDAVFSLFPFPNNPIGPYSENTFTQVLGANAEGTIFSAKYDHNFNLFGASDDSTFTARYNFTHDERQAPAVGGALFSAVEPQVGTQNLSLFLSSQLSGRLANQVRGSYGRTRLRFNALRDPFLAPSSLIPTDSPDSPFLLNRQERLINVTCTDVAGLPVRARAGCFPLQQRNRLGLYLAQAQVGSIGPNLPPVIGVENNLGPVGQLIVVPFSPVGTDSYLFPQRRVNNTFQVADTLAIFAGHHTFRVGADIRRTQLNSFLNRNFRPQIVFGGTTDLTFTAPVSGLPVAAQGLSRLGETPGFFSGADLAALGFPTGIFQSLSIGAPDTTIGLRFWQFNFFFNDTWRVRPGLALDYGLRYEYNTVPREAHERIERTFGGNLLPMPDTSLQLSGQSIQPLLNALNATFGALNNFLGGREAIYGPDRNNFGPHLSFAWDPWAGNGTQAGKTVVRAGAGMYYDVILGNIVSQSRNVFPTFIPFNIDVNLFSTALGGLYLPFPEGFTRLATPSVFGVTFRTSTGQPICRDSAGGPGCELVRPATLNELGIPPGALQAYLGRILNPAATGRQFSGSGLAFTLPDRDLRSPYAFHFNLQVERELFTDFLVNLAYVGTHGLKLTRLRTPNGGLNSPTSPLDILGLTGFQLAPAVASPPLSVPGTANPARPIAALGAFTIFDSSAASSYHALQANLTKRFSAGSQLTAAYTWSHAIDDVSDVFDLAGAFALPQDDRNLRAERGDANFDVRHRFSFSALTDFPFLRRYNQSGGATRALLGGWQFALISAFQTGQPFTVNTSFDVNFDGNLTDRPHKPNGIVLVDSRQRKLQLAGAPTSLLADIGRNGSVGRNTYRASGVARTDVTLIKNFRLREEQTIVLRVEAFNVFNRTQFGIPVRILEAPSFGQSVDTSLPARQVQFALKYVF